MKSVKWVGKMNRIYKQRCNSKNRPYPKQIKVKCFYRAVGLLI